MGYVNIESIVQKIKQSEHDNHINKKISCIFGKRQFSQLKYILVEREKQWMKVSNPQEIEMTNICRNKLHFGQAETTAFALKHVRDVMG